MKRSVFVLVILAACGGTDGGGGSGDDSLPKRGELATDPTIVSATAHCGPYISDGDPTLETKYVSLRVDASDPAGLANLGTCAAMLDTASDQGSYGDGSDCWVEMMHPCTVGMNVLVDLTVANRTGGVTTASVTLTTAQ